MIKDNQRTLFYKHVTQNLCKNKKVLEIGTGVGLLSYLILKAQPKSLISCDGNSQNILLAQKFLQQNNVDNNYKLLNKSSYDLDIPDDLDADIDIVIHELFASNGFGESFLQTLKNAKRFLNKGGRIVPGIFQLFYLPTCQPNLHKSSFDNIRNILPELDVSTWEDSPYMNKFTPFKCYLDKPQLVFQIDLNSNFLLSDNKIFELPPKCTGVMIYFNAKEGENTLTTLREGGPNHYFCRSFGEGIYQQFSKKSSKVRFSYNRENFSIDELD